MQEDDFNNFLKCLSPDPEEAARLYIRLQNKLVSLFRFNGISNVERAEIATFDRAIRKIKDGADVPNVTNYCLGIARNIVLEQRREEQREARAQGQFVDDLDDDSNALIDHIYHNLKPCFDQLSEDDRSLITSYCEKMKGRARAEHRRQLAESRGITLLALRMRITRIRTILDECVARQSRTV